MPKLEEPLEMFNRKMNEFKVLALKGDKDAESNFRSMRAFIIGINTQDFEMIFAQVRRICEVFFNHKSDIRPDTLVPQEIAKALGKPEIAEKKIRALMTPTERHGYDKSRQNTQTDKTINENRKANGLPARPSEEKIISTYNLISSDNPELSKGVRQQMTADKLKIGLRTVEGYTSKGPRGRPKKK